MYVQITVAINYNTKIRMIYFSTKKPRKEGEDSDPSVVTHNRGPQGFSATK